MRTMKITNRHGVSFNVIDLKPREYINPFRNQPERRVEFYDARSPVAFGQFIADYYVSTLMDGDMSRGLNLNGGVPVWNLNGREWTVIETWLKEGK